MSNRRTAGVRARWLRLAAFAGLALTGGCSVLYAHRTIPEPIRLIAVLPVVRTTPISATPIENGSTRVAPDAEKVVTAQIYSVLANSTTWRFVPDLVVDPALDELPSGGPLAQRARALGKAVGADGVLFGTVSRYAERVGSQYGAQRPAAVGLTLQLVSVSSGKVLWTGRFDQQQQPLTWNLFNWWQFWRGGPRWFTAEQFAHLAVERLLDDLARKLGY